ncbi:YraN family protein [Albirhodobacter sp. R86504]|uniref:YraN family protein n=1 Tax=Albirhodobacter sp. R86504 TaxID=3093848 RepID=UPI00366DBA39
MAELYRRQGYEIAASRWRGRSGEIDFIAQGMGGFVFVEVKSASTHDLAVQRVSPRQRSRLYAAAQEFLAKTRAGHANSARFDVALVDRSGCIKVIENAFGLEQSGW